MGSVLLNGYFKQKGKFKDKICEMYFVQGLLIYIGIIFFSFRFLSGFTLNTSSINLLHACKESICYQTRTVLNALSKDLKTWPQLSIMRIGGELSEDVGFLQMLADLCSITIERPHISTSASLGCMISAALAVKNLSIEEFFNICTPPIDFFYPAINPESKNFFNVFRNFGNF